MAKTKLKSALDQYRGRNIRLEKQRKKEKAARKRKELNNPEEAASDDGEDGGIALESQVQEELNKSAKKEKATKNGATKKKAAKAAAAAEPAEPEWETDEDENEEGSDVDDDDMPDRPTIDLARLEYSDSEGSSDDDDEEDEDPEAEEDDIPLSDIESLASEDKGDVIPHQRLTINNTTALTAALNRISLPYSKLAFSEHMAITSDEPTEIEDDEDDLNRELAFYKQSLAAVKDARDKLKKEGVSFSRPADYFAEMVKSDEHMGKIKQKLVDDAAGKKAAAEARRQRDLKKFGKQVQTAKLQERAKEKRDTIEKINLLKRKRQGAEVTNTKEEDLFDVELDKTEMDAPSSRADRRNQSGQANHKRQRKDAKYGFGGKKRHSKSNDAISSADGRDFSHKKMKGNASKQRPGKNRRANAR
ncbi:Ebp2-domain-containing protein [Aaosphaeria arxii CBS 175.79]|uniref:Ebp2-domain-containing protein n=1 Tax=Aaosphaeria arxii CBS 175.79 TaxID=1450172 RepID=A0A6A5X7S4_9PLEO|nr:Ebp2-domain-containing protein [Aaosphaeria arxii CBS 175.79]KAF2009085.1 Ebp2-domain-containing protein [Aaosphaeria arxii CBS 175.79]